MTTSKFATDIESGLSKKDKELSSMYFYDAKGDELFMQIMKLPEYYLTRAETAIFSSYTREIISDFLPANEDSWDLVELGAGDGVKTKILLQELVGKTNFTYTPIDISANVLKVLEKNMLAGIPDLDIQPLAGDYFQALDKIKVRGRHTVVLFLGSSIGNMQDEIATDFLYSVAGKLQKGDIIFLGADNIKPKEIVLPAYNDARGITKAFNLNLLTRINRELDANFQIENFDHCPEYNESTGIATSYIKSLKDQEVYIDNLQSTFTFKKGEKIKTEISRKYDPSIINELIHGSGLKIERIYSDPENLFNDYLLRKI